MGEEQVSHINAHRSVKFLAERLQDFEIIFKERDGYGTAPVAWFLGGHRKVLRFWICWSASRLLGVASSHRHQQFFQDVRGQLVEMGLHLDGGPFPANSNRFVLVQSVNAMLVTVVEL